MGGSDLFRPRRSRGIFPSRDKAMISVGRQV
jgi:hypothetical protein